MGGLPRELEREERLDLPVHDVMTSVVTVASSRRRSYLAQSVLKVVLQKSISPQTRQLILYLGNIWNKLTNLCGN